MVNGARSGRRGLLVAILVCACALLVVVRQLIRAPERVVQASLDRESSGPPRRQESPHDPEGRTGQHSIPEERLTSELQVLRVLTRDERPISGAVVTLANTMQLGAASSNGEIAVPGDAFGSSAVLTADGFVPLELLLTPSSSGMTIVHMQSGLSISGVVRDLHGMPIEGAAVMAVSPLYYFDDRALESTLSGVPLIPLDYCDIAGRFNLIGLDGRLQYRVFAAGGGCAVFDERKFVAPGDGVELELVARPVYGAVVSVVDASGGAPATLSDQVRLKSFAFPVAIHADSMFTTRWTRRLLGLDTDSCAALSSNEDQLFFIAREDLGESIGVNYRAVVAGYEPLDTTFELCRARGSVPRREVMLTRSCDAFGEVAVIITPPTRVEALAAAVTKGRECKLRLKEHVTGIVVEAILCFDSAGMEVVNGVPFGDYSVELRSPHSWFSYPNNYQAQSSVRIGRERSMIEVFIPPLGVIEMKVTTPDSLEYRGPLMGSLLRVEDNSMNAFYFSSGPYRIPLVPDGEYRVVVDNLGADCEPANVMVRATDTTALVTWHLSW